VSFIDLVRREWSQQADDGSLPKKQYGITQVARAIVGWVVLQGVTQQWQERRWLKYLKEMDIKDPPKIHDSEPRTRKYALLSHFTMSLISYTSRTLDLLTFASFRTSYSQANRVLRLSQQTSVNLNSLALEPLLYTFLEQNLIYP
jgi:hypothetical protein